MNEDWKPVVNALLGTWPSQVASWGPEVLSAYLHQLGRRGMGPTEAVRAIEACDDRFPPAAGQLAAMKSAPHLTGDDVVRAIFDGPLCILKARAPYPNGPILEPEKRRNEAATKRASDIDPLLGSFVTQHLRWLRHLQVDHEMHGELNRKEVRRAWTEFVENREGREVAAVTAGRGGHLRALDAMQAVSGLRPVPQIEEQT